MGDRATAHRMFEVDGCIFADGLGDPGGAGHMLTHARARIDGEKPIARADSDGNCTQ